MRHFLGGLLLTVGLVLACGCGADGNKGKNTGTDGSPPVTGKDKGTKPTDKGTVPPPPLPPPPPPK